MNTESPHPTTTHASPGEGRPRLVFAVGDDYRDGDVPREFDLELGVTLIGSSSNSHLQLGGLLPLHAEIRHDSRDEYVLFIYGAAKLSNDTDVPGECKGHVLRTGSRVDLGEWRMSFFREEFADHGRPFGGRQGGELAHQKRQPLPEYR